MNGQKKKIEDALHQFADGDLADNAKHLLNVLGTKADEPCVLDRTPPRDFLKFSIKIQSVA